jgi:hypothetical protein
MFESLLERLQEDVQVVKNVLTLHDELRSQFYRPAASGEDPWSTVRLADPTKLAWQIYDHCAAFTRLYSIYEQFVEELASEYLLLLPELYEQYDELPPALLKQHRQGIGQILLKLGKEGPYRHLEASIIIPDFSRGIRGERKYRLLSDAFFVDRQNYRLDAVKRLFSVLGFGDVGHKITRSIPLRRFLAVERSGAQTVEGELAEFVRYRNEAAHTEVTNVVSMNEIKSKADFIILFCRVLADIVKEELFRHEQDLGHFIPLGRISEIFQKGQVAIVRLESSKLTLGDEIVIYYPESKKRFIVAKIVSLQFNEVNCSALTTKGELEVGIRFDQTIRLGGELRRMKPMAVASPSILDSADITVAVEPEDGQVDSLVEGILDDDERSDPND